VTIYRVRPPWYFGEVATARGGIIIGRFMPPHLGHQYLIDFAHHFCGDVTVFLCSLSHEPIPGELRRGWLEQMVPYVTITHITEEIPEAARDRDGAYAIWAHAVRERMDHDPRFVFASEEYGAPLAKELGARFIPVDPQREAFPVSAGMIRENPYAHWRFVPAVVRPYFARKVVVLDRDGSLGRGLASEFQTLFVADYAAHVQSLPEASPSLEELLYAQLAGEAAVLSRTNGFVVTNANQAQLLESEPEAQERARLVESAARRFPHTLPDLVIAADGAPGLDSCERAGWKVISVTGLADAVEVTRAWFLELTKI
jgi:NadR type nicotinamide-nucleotide adenylyltransferase